MLFVFSVVKKRHEARGTRLEVFGFLGMVLGQVRVDEYARV